MMTDIVTMDDDTKVDESSQVASPNQLKNSYIKPFLHTDLSMRGLPLMQARSPKDGPVLWLTACAHGDEVGGTIVIQEIFKRLKKYPLLQGAINAFPIMNPIGLEMAVREIPFSREDLNRSFPGDPQGSLAGRMAAKIFQTIEETKPALVLDLHNDWIHSIPYAVLDSASDALSQKAAERSLELAHQGGFVIVNETRPIAGSLSYALLKQHIPVMTLELGESFVANEKNISRGVQMIWNILGYLEMIDGPEEAFQMDLPQEFFGKGLRYTEAPLASSSGLIRFHCQPGQGVKKDQVLAKVYNPFGKLLETLRAQNDGLILGYCDSSFAYPGASVIAMALC